jgi:hypothetical protein
MRRRVKYFIMQGLIPEAYEGAPHIGGNALTARQERIKRWKATESTLPREDEYVFLRQRRVGTVSVLVHDVYDTLLMVSAPSQRKAYALALPFRSYLTVYLGYSLNDSYEFLLELTAKPALTATTRKIASLYRQLGSDRIDLDVLSSTMVSGTRLFHPQIRSACKFVERTLNAPQLAASLTHLERSHFLFAGHMTSYYYHRHYRHQRRLESAYLREKKYLEDRTLYDLAFLSAFRALEALLGTAQIKEHDIGQRLRALDDKFGTSFCSTRWKSYHEVFSSGRKRWRFDELIAHYLRVRNAVAAHANPRPPFPLREDQVLEIQRLVASMLYDAAGKPQGLDAPFISNDASHT